MSQPKTVCQIGFKHGFEEGNIFSGRDALDNLQPCCSEFMAWFWGSGNAKRCSFNEVRDSGNRDGFFFEARNGKIILILKVVDKHSTFAGGTGLWNEVNFCPFCGAKVEIKQTRVVQLIRLTREVFEGYKEIESQAVPTPTAVP
jgi:hypothetical protein